MLQPPVPDSQRSAPPSNSTMLPLPAPHRTDSQQTVSEDSQATNTSGPSVASDRPATNTTGPLVARDSPATNAPGPPVASQTVAVLPGLIDQYCNRWSNHVTHVKTDATTALAVLPTPGRKTMPAKAGKKNAMKVIKAVPKQRPSKMVQNAETRTDSSKVFDKTWFKIGGPKYYGCVTVCIDKKIYKYRIKPKPGSRAEYRIAWGNTDEQQQGQWRKVMEHVREFNKKNLNYVYWGHALAEVHPDAIYCMLLLHVRPCWEVSMGPIL